METTGFKEVTDHWGKESGGKRYLRSLSPDFWVSVLYRRTGFGYWEWETTIVRILDDKDPKKYARGEWDDRELLTVRGDHRETLNNKTEEEIMVWYQENSHNKNSFETLIDALKEKP